MKLPLNNLNYPVKISVGNSTGSGFLISFNSNIYLVTAKHVLYQQDGATKIFSLYGDNLRITCYTFLEKQSQHDPIIYEVDLKIISSNNNLKFHPTADIVIIKLGVLDEKALLNYIPGISKIQESSGAVVHYSMDLSRKFDEIEITNNVFVLGYPVSLSTVEMKQINYDTPLVRKGIIAGKNYDNKTVILDCPVYGGNSGGMVLEINQDNAGKVSIHLIGVVVQFIPFVDQWRNVRFPELYNSNFQNSGYSVALPVDYIFDLIQEIGIV
ncbi:MAG: trypsin-like peptidase domain-containing protein [bacterium]